MMTVAWPLSPGACVIMSPWCHQPQPQMTESSPSLQITLDMTHTTLSPGSHLVLVSKTWAWQNNLAAREWHLNDWSPAGPGSQSPWCWQLVIHVHAARVITQLPRCNDNTQQVSIRAWSRAETKHRGYWWSLASCSKQSPTSLSAIAADVFSLTRVHCCCLMSSLTSHETLVITIYPEERHGSRVTWPDTGSQLSTKECDRATATVRTGHPTTQGRGYWGHQAWQDWPRY